MIKMETDEQKEAKLFQEIYDGNGPGSNQSFIELQGLSKRHVLKEEDLVVPLLDHVISGMNNAPDNFVGLEEVAREFLSNYLEMKNEHETAKSTAHKYANLAKITKNRRAYNIWTSIEDHMDLESKALELACAAASKITKPL